MTITGLQYPISAGKHEATITEVGAGLRTYRHAGGDVTCPYSEDVLPPKGCGMTMVPWPNRIRGGRYTFDGINQQLAITEPGLGNASHGLGRWARWSAVEHQADRVTLRLDVVPQNGYPHELRADITYALDAATGLAVTVTATNIGATRAPFGTGNHPYLAVHGGRLDEVTVHVPAASVLVVDEAKLPVGRRSVAGTPDDLGRVARLGSRRFDACFTDVARDEAGRGVAEVRVADGGARLWFAAAYGFVQVFTVDELAPGGEAGVAVEPMTCPADAFNSRDGLIVLEPGASWAGSWGIQPLGGA